MSKQAETLSGLDFYNTGWAEEWSDMVRYSPVCRHTNRWIMKLIRLLPEKPKTIADLGCGNGKLLNYLHTRIRNVKFLGSDLSDQGVEQCKRRFPNGLFVQQDLTQISNPFQQVVDLVVCSEVIEHLEDDQSAFASFSLMCRYLIITVPSGPVDEMARRMGHYRHYTANELSKKLKDAGFDVIYKKTWGGPFSYPLYSFFRNKAGVQYVTGEYSVPKKILTHILYFIFYFNDLFNFGDKVFILAKNQKITA